jgi:hypothetical protein
MNHIRILWIVDVTSEREGQSYEVTNVAARYSFILMRIASREILEMDKEKRHVIIGNRIEVIYTNYL